MEESRRSSTCSETEDSERKRSEEEQDLTLHEKYNLKHNTDYKEHHVYADDGITLLSDLLIETEEQKIARSRCEYHARRLLMENEITNIFGYIDMNILRRLFLSYDTGIDLETFILLIQQASRKTNNKNSKSKPRYSSSNPETNSRIKPGKDEDRRSSSRASRVLDGVDIGCLIEFFKEMDLDGDGEITWEEFLSFSAIMTGVDRKSEFERELQMFNKQSRVSTDLQRCYISPMTKLIHIPKKNYIGNIFSDQPVVNFYSASSGRHITALKTHCLATNIMYLDKGISLPYKLMTTHVDNSIKAWNMDEGPSWTHWTERNSWIAPSTQMSIASYNSRECFFSGGVNGDVCIWKYRSPAHIGLLKYHTLPVLDLLSLEEYGLVVSASLDNTVSIWDTHCLKQREALLGHKRGVLSLAYHEDLKLIMSAGFDHQVFLWTPLTNRNIAKLEGHQAPLLNVVASDHRPEAISADSNGIVKVWDLRTHKCLQTFDLIDGAEPSCSPQALEIYPIGKNRSRLAIGTKRLSFFDQEPPIEGEEEDDLPLGACFFNEELLSIVTAAGRTIKIWDAVTGKVKQTYRKVVATDISALCVDHRNRKLCIGDISGLITVISHQTGTYMKTMTRHRPEGVGIIDLKYVPEKIALFAIFEDSTIALYDEAGLAWCKVISQFSPAHRHSSPLQAVAFSDIEGDLRVLSVSTNRYDSIRVWNKEINKCKQHIELQKSEEDNKSDVLSTSCSKDNLKAQYDVLCLSFLAPSPYIAIGCTDGKVRILKNEIIKAEPKRKKIIKTEKQKKNENETDGDDVVILVIDNDVTLEEESSSETKIKNKSRSMTQHPVLCIQWDKVSQKMFTGNDFGELKCWNVDIASLYSKTMKNVYSSLQWTFRGHDDGITYLKYVPIAKSILSSSYAQDVKAWRCSDGFPFGGLGVNPSMLTPRELLLATKNNLHGFGVKWKLPLDLRDAQKHENHHVRQVTLNVIQAYKQHKKKQLLNTLRAVIPTMPESSEPIETSDMAIELRPKTAQSGNSLPTLPTAVGETNYDQESLKRSEELKSLLNKVVQDIDDDESDGEPRPLTCDVPHRKEKLRELPFLQKCKPEEKPQLGTYRQGDIVKMKQEEHAHATHLIQAKKAFPGLECTYLYL